MLTKTTKSTTFFLTSILFMNARVYFQINSASNSDGGNYTCSPQNIIPDSVTVTIMDGEGKSAAVYKDTVSSGMSSDRGNAGFLVFVILVLVY